MWDHILGIFLRILYSMLMAIALPFVFLRLLLRGRKNKGYLKRWGERLGARPRSDLSSEPFSIWFHAVSLGEIIALWPTILHFAEQQGSRIYLSTTTPTSSDWIKKQLTALSPEKGRKIVHGYFPYDLPILLNRVFNRVRPKLIVVMETEFWWNWYHIAYRRQIPIVIVNGRISESAYRRYLACRFWTRRVLQYPTWIGTDSKSSYNRFLNLGTPAERLHCMGNIKWDNPISPRLIELGHQIKATLTSNLGPSSTLWTAGSTHEGEEDLILALHLRLRSENPDRAVRLFWVPRHPERFETVRSKCQNAGLNVIKRSEQITPPPSGNWDVFLVDLMGELPLYYAASHWATIGGTWIPIGGHNPLEALSLGVPIITGPHTWGIDEMLNAFTPETVQKCADLQLDTLLSIAQKWTRDPEKVNEVGKEAAKICAKFIGIRQAWHDKIKEIYDTHIASP